MSKLPKKTGKNWAIVAAIFSSLFAIMMGFVVVFGSGLGGFYFGEWVVGFMIVLIGFIIVKGMVAREVRSKVKYERGDADVFTNDGSDIICVIVMGIIINVIAKLIPSSILVAIGAYVIFYYVYKAMCETPELELYAKYNRVNKRKSSKND